MADPRQRLHDDRLKELIRDRPKERLHVRGNVRMLIPHRLGVEWIMSLYNVESLETSPPINLSF